MTKIAFIDLEGTLIDLGNWSRIARKFGAEKITDEFFKLYEQGKIGFYEWRRELVKIWKKNKVTRQQFIDTLKDYKLKQGARELILGLKEKGFKIIIITGAAGPLAETVKNDLGIDEVYSAHEFIFDEKGEFQDIQEHENYRRGQGKVDLIKELIKKEGADINDCIAIGGDDINDYWMLKELKSFAVNPHLRQIKEVVDYEVDELIDILDAV